MDCEARPGCEQCPAGDRGHRPHNAGAVPARFKSHPSSALYMAEPFEPWRARLHDMPAEDAVKTGSEALAKVE